MTALGGLYPRVNEKAHRKLNRAEGLDIASVLEASGGICGVCRKPVERDDATRDLRIPLVLGGKPTPDNLQIAHNRCNSGRNPEFGALAQAPPLKCPTCGKPFYYRAVIRCYGDPLPIRAIELQRTLRGLLSASEKQRSHQAASGHGGPPSGPASGRNRRAYPRGNAATRARKARRKRARLRAQGRDVPPENPSSPLPGP
jgi:hypothetical protein